MTEQKQAVIDRLLEAFSQTNNQTVSCKMAGVSRATYVRWVEDGSITADQLADAYAQFQDMLRQQLITRGLIGELQPLVVNGRIVRDMNGDPAMINKRDNRVFLEIVKRHLPEYADKDKTLIIKNGGSSIPVEFSVEFDARDVLPAEWAILKDIAQAIEDRKKGVVNAGQ